MHIRLRMLSSLLVAGAVGACSSNDPGAVTTEVSSGETTLTVGAAVITIPDGAVPQGTSVTARELSSEPPESIDGFAAYEAVGKGVELKFENDLQPAVPLVATFPVDDPDAAHAVVLQGGSPPELLPASSVDGTATAQIPHLSSFWSVKIDFDQIGRQAADFVLQSTGVEYPEPSCVNDRPTIDGLTYSPIQGPGAWVCTTLNRGRLRVESSPNSPVPYTVTSEAKPSAQTHLSDLDLGSVLYTVLADRVSGPGDAVGVSAPGVRTRFDYSGKPRAFDLTYVQRPDLLLGSILIKTIDVVAGGVAPGRLKDALDDLQCLAAVFDVETAQLSAGTAAGIIRGFFDCVGPVLELGRVQQVVVALLSSAPQAFVGSVNGAINEATGRARFVVPIERDGRDTTSTITLGVPQLPDGETRFERAIGLGETKPRRYSYDPSGIGLVEMITWKNWGSDVSTGAGQVFDHGITADYVPVVVRAFNIGTCNGQRVYRSVSWRYRDVPDQEPVTINACDGTSRNSE